jgi:hypothetical protein
VTHADPLLHVQEMSDFGAAGCWGVGKRTESQVPTWVSNMQRGKHCGLDLTTK